MTYFCSLIEPRTPTPSPTYTRVFQRSPPNLPWAYYSQPSPQINLTTHPIIAAGNMLVREMPEDMAVKVKRPVETTLVLNKGSLVVFDMSSICGFLVYFAYCALHSHQSIHSCLLSQSTTRTHTPHPANSSPHDGMASQSPTLACSAMARGVALVANLVTSKALLSLPFFSVIGTSTLC